MNNLGEKNISKLPTLENKPNQSNSYISEKRAQNQNESAMALEDIDKLGLSWVDKYVFYCNYHF